MYDLVVSDLRSTGGSLNEFTVGGGTRTMTPDQMNVDALMQSQDYFNTGTQSEFASTGGFVQGKSDQHNILRY